MQKLYLPTVRNTFVNSPHYGSILKQYNAAFDANPKLNDKKFFETVISPLIPNYKLMSWYQFLRRWKNSAGLKALELIPRLPQADPVAETELLEKRLVANDIATSEGINAMLNLGRLTLAELVANPEELKKIPLKDRIEFLTKAMKAQDSRIHALGKVREDSREQVKFERAFNNAAFED